MIELRNGTGLALQAVAKMRIAFERLRKDFDGDRSIEAGVARAIHNPHTTGSERRDDSYGPSFAPGLGGLSFAVASGRWIAGVPSRLYPSESAR